MTDANPTPSPTPLGDSDRGSNIASALTAMARAQPEAAAIHLPVSRGPAHSRTYLTLTYRQLDEASNQVASGLASFGIERGQRAALLVPPSPELFALVFGLYKAGVVPVMVDPGIGLGRFGACIEQAQPQAFIGVSLAHAVRVLFGWGRASMRTHITVGRRWFWGGATYKQLLQAGRIDAEIAPTAADDPAAILFTSGATGPPKGVLYRHRHFAEQVRMIGGLYGIQPGEVDLPTFPLFALFDPALGMTTVIPRMDFTKPARVDPKEIIGAVRRFSATNLFGSPALLDTVVSYAVANNEQMPTLRRVITAGAPVRPDILRKARAVIAPDGCIHTPYGATENLPVSSVESRTILDETEPLTASGHGVCVGHPHPDNDVVVIAITDEALPTWDRATPLAARKIGEITVMGPTTTDTYFGRPEATKKAKIDCSGETRHRMGDAGYFDDQGRLWYCGRLAHRLVVDGQMHFTLPAEGIFNAHADVHRCALVGAAVGATVGGRVVPTIVWERAPNSRRNPLEIEAELAALRDRYEASACVAQFLFYGAGKTLPVDIRHNAKIDRPVLQRWATKRTTTGPKLLAKSPEPPAGSGA